MIRESVNQERWRGIRPRQRFHHVTQVRLSSLTNQDSRPGSCLCTDSAGVRLESLTYENGGYEVYRSLAACVAVLFAVSAAPAAEAGKPVDVVICLDVSGSMDGLLSSASVKLWDVVNDLAKVQPTPRLRVGLYSYGNNRYDAAAGWVRKEADLTADLDVIYQKLNELKIAGPNSEEYVARVCRDALDQQSWSAEKDAVRLIFVCGNESARQDKVVTLADVARKAVAKDVLINTIYCGPANHADAAGYKEFATSSKGQFAAIDQDRGTVVIATPQDKELAELSGKLSDTYLSYGKRGKDAAANQQLKDRNALQQGEQVAAARAATKATEFYRNAAWDLVDKLKEDPKFDIKQVPEDELPDILKKLKPAEREAYVKEMLAKREAMQKRIAELQKQREAHIAQEMKRNATAGDRALDAALRKTIREQAGAKGIKVPE